jgi:hypothetical protein
MVSNRVIFLVYAQMGWMLVLLALLVLIDELAYDFFIISSFIGLWVLVELATPFEVSPLWERRLRRLMIPQLLVCVYLLTLRILETVGIGVRV